MRLRVSASAAVCALLLPVPMLAAGEGGRNSAAATEVRVRIFSTQVVKSLSVMSEHATMRLCERCASTPIAEPLSLAVGPGAGELLVNGKKSPQSAWLDGQLKLTAEGGRTATAAGQWQVSAAADGLHVVLTVPSERYVMAVLASEAAPDEPAESLKALAVVARSFALVTPKRHGLEGLCDSTHCQAMHMARVPDRIEAAVQATAGETLWSGGRRVEGYFTQNCGGVTADAAEVWGGLPKAWLVSHGDAYCQRVPSQWHVAVDERQLREAMAAEGWHVPGPLTGFRIVAKDGSGRAVRVELRGGGKPLMVRAASLRFAVNRALGWNTLRSDWYAVQMLGGRVVFEGKGYGHGVGLCQAGAAGMARLGKGYREVLGGYFPGAFVRVDAGDDGWTQTEANGWSLRWVGKKTLTQKAQRWDAKGAKGSSGEDDLMAAGDAAWARARGLWRGGAGVRPVVVIAPSTELFRQMTGQPGWALASTSGWRVVLQPLAVVRRNAMRATLSSGPGARRGGAGSRGLKPASLPVENVRAEARTYLRSNGADDKGLVFDEAALESLLSHEFLHVLLEADAGDAAPLWLREGLVEMLAGERGEVSAMKPEAIDGALRHAGSLPDAQAAHRAACGLVRKLVAQRGEAAVRGWLRNGIPAGVGF